MWFRGYHPDKYSLTFLTFGVTLTLSTVIQFFRRTLWLIMLYYQTEFGCNRTSSLEDSRNCYILIIRALVVTLTLKIAIESFCMSVQLIMMHHNTESGSKMFCGLENIIWINIDILTLRCDLDLECNNPIFPQDALAYDNL